MRKITLKSEKEISFMAEAGLRLSKILNQALKKAVPGTSTFAINEFIEKEILKFGGFPSFKTVPSYHWASCVGLNQEVVHSIPKKEKIIQEGDLVKIDLGMLWQGLHTDTSWTKIAAGNLDSSQFQEKKYFLEAGKEALSKAINQAIPGNRVGHISKAIQETIESSGFHPVVILTGHGIGTNLHEEPMIPGVLRQPISDTPKLEPGMTLAIEIIYNFGSPEVVLENDNWTVSTKDGKISALFEETIAVTKNGPLVLTPSPEGENKTGEVFV